MSVISESRFGGWCHNVGEERGEGKDDMRKGKNDVKKGRGR